MSEARLLDRAEGGAQPRHQRGALELARRLPSLIVAAKEVSASVMHGVHGRRRAGVGESFWQFRPFTAGEAASRIDWRRSARDDRLYVREREWEAAHTVSIWIDRSRTMDFVSNLALSPKIDRAMVLGLAAADLLVRGGERVGMPGLIRPLASRGIVERLAEAMMAQAARPGDEPAQLPPADALAPRTQAILISDFLADADAIAQTITGMAARGALGHLVMIADPAEETFPFSGHAEFADVHASARLRVGRAESLRAEYLKRLAAHRERVRAAAAARGWSFALHRTDRPAAQALLALRVRLEAAMPGVGA